MNIFIMILVALFMAGYYMLDSPSQRVEQHTTEFAITLSDLRGVAQCTAAAHNAQINGTEFADICVEQNNITSKFICLDKNNKITGCEIQNNKKPTYSYIITVTDVIDFDKYNDMMDVLERYYPDAGTFGIFEEKQIISGGTSTKRIVPAAIIKDMNLVDGQLVYLTQYELPDTGIVYDSSNSDDIVCPLGTAKTYRFGRWQCIAYNTKTDCGGDMIWDSELYECVPDQSRRPLCGANQTAVMVDEVWECINPFPEKTCPNKMIARLNYNTLEWECVVDPTKTPTTKKCHNVIGGAIYGEVGKTLQIPHTSCTPCETMVTDPETCETHCVPDPSKINDAACYPGDIRECSGPTRAFYFGFPNQEYAKEISELDTIPIPIDTQHAQNKKFNCLDCVGGEIDKSLSLPPYVAVCK